jgi:hypothetical protein
VASIFLNVALVECADTATADELARGSLARFVYARVSDRVLAVDHERYDEVLKTLRRGGQTPKITTE